MDSNFFLILVELQNDSYSMSLNEFSDQVNLEKANSILGKFVAKINSIPYDESKIKVKFFAIVAKLKSDDVIDLVENKMFLKIPFTKTSFKKGTLKQLDNENLPFQINFVLNHNFSSVAQQQLLVDNFKDKWINLDYVFQKQELPQEEE